MSKSPLTHALCFRCWKLKHPNRAPITLIADKAREEKCCKCGELTSSGIYVRGMISEYQCKGVHSDGKHKR